MSPGYRGQNTLGRASPSNKGENTLAVPNLLIKLLLSQLGSAGERAREGWRAPSAGGGGAEFHLASPGS